MKVKTIITFTVLVVAAAIWAQDAKDIFSELQQAKTVSAPVQDSSLGVTVSSPVQEQVAAPEVKAPVAPVQEPAPAVVVKEETKPAVDETMEVVAITPEKAGQGAINAGLITLNVKGADLNSVIRLFTELSGANIISPELDAATGASKVDVNIKNVEWKPALQAILDGKDLELYEKIPGANVYSMRKKLPAAEAAKNTRTFLFKHADIKQAEEVIKGVVGDRGQVYAYPQGNAIVVKTTQEIMDDVAQIAERIDTARQQVLIEARILELSDTDSNDRGVNFDWTDMISGSASADNPLDGKLDFVSAATLPATLSSVGTLTLSSADLDVTIKALQARGNVRTVSSPKVIVANGQQASIRIVTREPVIRSEPTFSENGDLTSILYNQDEDGTDETGRKRYATYDYGIMLSVTPTIYSEDNIAVRIVPVISRENTEKGKVTRYIGSGTNGVSLTFPIIDEKRVDTTFMLANHETAVIGGLTETDDQETESKVPLLGSIPLIRHLFTYKHNSTIQKENIIFVTVSLEDGKNFDVQKAVSQSPLTRRQIVKDENQKIVDDRAVESFKDRDAARVKEDIKVIERNDQAEKHEHMLRKPLWNVLRP